jgi:hypothetical protein
MIIAWSGWGWVTFPILILGLVIGSAVGEGLANNENLGGAVGGFVSCLVLWFWGRHLNRYNREHTMWAVPMHWWGVTFILFGAGTGLLVALYTT